MISRRSTPAFPPARIKRIMLSDEDVGKIKKETPILVSLCVEIFIGNLVNTGAAIAASKGAKILSASHLKKVVVNNIKFDFLHDVVSKIPDTPDAADSNEDGDETEPPPTKRSKKNSTKKIETNPSSPVVKKAMTRRATRAMQSPEKEAHDRVKTASLEKPVFVELDLNRTVQKPMIDDDDYDL